MNESALMLVNALADDCFHCGEFIHNDEHAWFWVGKHMLTMHTRCLVDWLPRVMQDAMRINLAARSENADR